MFDCAKNDNLSRTVVLENKITNNHFKHVFLNSSKVLSSFCCKYSNYCEMPVKAILLVRLHVGTIVDRSQLIIAFVKLLSSALNILRMLSVLE